MVEHLMRSSFAWRSSISADLEGRLFSVLTETALHFRYPAATYQVTNAIVDAGIPVRDLTVDVAVALVAAGCGARKSGVWRWLHEVAAHADHYVTVLLERRSERELWRRLERQGWERTL